MASVVANDQYPMLSGVADHAAAGSAAAAAAAGAPAGLHRRADLSWRRHSSQKQTFDNEDALLVS